MSVRIVIDSTTDTAEHVWKRCTVVPLTVQFGDETYIDGVTISHREFYEKLIESDVLPTTSQPTPDAFAQVYRRALEAGEEVVVLTVSSALSGTYQSASIAAMDFPEGVYVVDGKNVALGTGILAELALEMAERGCSAAEIAAELECAREDVHLIALLDTLEYLRRGGRISKTAAIAGGILSIKPVICIRDGEIAVLGKARGSRQGNNLLVKEIESAGGVDFGKPILLGYTG
ncbi:MAG: DegV family protein, partial [Oscillospiraceae bacterium]|nr:DegV family protein [Oscillospiraceae bacterium]